jgi:outer membrane PBP1 activator LpoA protein
MILAASSKEPSMLRRATLRLPSLRLPASRFPSPAVLLAALLLAGLSACSSVRTTPTVVRDAGPATPVRNDRANTLDFPPGDEDGYRPPAQLALLLPMTGTLAPAGASVRDGFLAAYYGETRRRPVVKFYDTHGTGGGAQAAAARAISEGAQMLVGPLGREEVNAISLPADKRLPWIALNRGTRAPGVGQSSFALVPEEEGMAVAERLLDRKLTRVLVFANRGDNATRSVAAFKRTLMAGGGSVVAEIPVSGEIGDVSAQIAALQSGATPAQAVFLVLEAGQARAVAAQLKTSAAASLPRIATALILSGANARADIELDGIEYPESPWLLGQGSGLPMPENVRVPSARGGGQRLFAFGADAWKLAAYFEHLYNDPSASVRGATGLLQIDIAGPVHRTPGWAVFSGGRGRIR